MSSEHLVGCCERLPLAFLIAAQVSAQRHPAFPARNRITSLSLIPLRNATRANVRLIVVFLLNSIHNGGYPLVQV